MDGKVSINLSFDDFSILEKANSFSEMPQRLKNYFQGPGINISSNASLIKDVKVSWWYLIDSSSQFLEVFYLALDKVHNSSVEIKIVRETPTHSGHIHDYPIYQVGISFKKDENLFISGQEREGLTEKQLKKWDYFFRASPDMVGHRHRFLADMFEEWKKSYQQKMFTAGWKAGLIVLASIFLLFSVWKILAVPVVLYGIYRFRHIFLDILNANSKIETLKKIIERLEREKVMLESQTEQTSISGERIERWLNEEIRKEDERSVLELGLPADKEILRLEVADGQIKFDQANKIIGLTIKEWGITQPLSANGKATIEKKHWHHLRAYRYNKGRPLLGVYYLHFIYMTPDTIGFCGFFYDFILEKRFGTYTQQLFYRDIVNIGTREEETKVLSGQDEWQTKQVIMSFTNGEKITIALTDPVAIEALSAQLEKSSDTERSLELPDQSLPATRVNLILNNVKTYWNEKKGIKSSPREDLLQ